MSNLYCDNYWGFVRTGGRLLKNIFSDFSPEFEKELLDLVKTKVEKNLFIVLAIIKNYHEENFLYKICQEIVKTNFEDKKCISEVELILGSTGVTSGEFGIVDALERRKSEISEWLKNPNANVQNFSKIFTKKLETAIAFERKRIEEDIASRKHFYGSDE